MNDWNEKIEKTMVNLGCKCGAYRIMHDESADYCARLDSYLTIGSITLSTLTATGIFSIEDNSAIKTASGIAVYFIAFLTSIKQFLKLSELTEKHKTFSMRFSVLYRDIQRQLCLNKKDRQNGKEYLTFINNEMDNLLFTNPHIPYKIKKKNLGDYAKNSGYETSLAKDIYDIIIDVDVDVDTHKPTNQENKSEISNEIEEESGQIKINDVSESAPQNNPQNNPHYKRYLIDRFLHND